MARIEPPRGRRILAGWACRRGRHRLTFGLASAVLLSFVLAACGGEGDADTAVRRAEAKVEAKKKALSDTQSELSAATDAFCDTSTDYILALDRYGDVLTSTAPTVGDVNEAGADLVNPQGDAIQAAEDTVAAREAVTAAEDDLAQAKAELKAVKAGEEPSPAPTSSESLPPLAPTATVNRVKQAESEFESVRGGIDERMPLTEASQQFNAAAVALEISWLQLFADAGCLTDEQQDLAAAAVREYTLALQNALEQTGYYDGEVDGIYGPQTVAAVEALQGAHQLPVTGTVDKATATALQSDVLAAGGAAAQEELAATAALQQTLTLAGYWDGPVDGLWTPALTEALGTLQTDLGVKPTGTVDAATIAAVKKAIAELGASQTAEATPSAPSTDQPETETPATETPATSTTPSSS